MKNQYRENKPKGQNYWRRMSALIKNTRNDMQGVADVVSAHDYIQYIFLTNR